MKHYKKELVVNKYVKSPIDNGLPGVGFIDEYMKDIGKKFAKQKEKDLKSQLTLEILYSAIDKMKQEEYKPKPFIVHPDVYQAMNAHFIYDSSVDTMYRNIKIN